ncbi:MAG: hypothetical protein COA73_12625 [Candidatus Hydrogenedentota bacterium]|nr:MAG: hypothetical protein COA73_12625 [Candidatus Hydrogenedentota bacterium]
MRTHRTIWFITAGFAILAFFAVVFRQPPDSDPRIPTPAIISAAERDRLILEMNEALEMDWRVRRELTQRLVEAVAVYSQHPDLNTAETDFALGLVRYYGRGDVNGAEAAFRKAAERAPDWSWPQDKLGVLLYTAGDKTGGLQALEKSMALDPDWSRPHSDLAILYRLEGDMDRSMTEVMKALKLEPDNPSTRYNYAVVLDYSGYMQEARDQYYQVLELDNALPAPYYNLACGYAKEGNSAKALEYLAAAIDLDQAFHLEALGDPDFDTIRETPDFFEFMIRRSPR